MKETLDIDGILKIAENASENEIHYKEKKKRNLRIAVAKDEAFCFLYEDNLDYLRQSGCELTYFSPLKDSILPENIDGLLLYGGYPELHAEELSENISMRKDIAGRIQSGLPCIAECGGFLYLHEYLETPDKEKYPMAGIIRGTGYNAGKLQRFGYMSVKSVKNTMLADKNQSFRAHEFHYYDSDNNGESCVAVKPVSGTSWTCIHEDDRNWWGYPHLYYPSNPAFVEHFVQAARLYHRERNAK